MDPVKELFASSLEPCTNTSSTSMYSHSNQKTATQTPSTPSQVPKSTTQPSLQHPVFTMSSTPNISTLQPQQQQQMMQQNHYQSIHPPNPPNALFTSTASQSSMYYSIPVTMENMKQHISTAFMGSPSAGISRPYASSLALSNNSNGLAIFPGHQVPPSHFAQTSSSTSLGTFSGPLFIAQPGSSPVRPFNPLQPAATSNLPSSQNPLKTITNTLNHGYPRLQYSPRPFQTQEAAQSSLQLARSNMVKPQILSWSYPASPDSLPNRSKKNSPTGPSDLSSAQNLEQVFAAAKEKLEFDLASIPPSTPPLFQSHSPRVNQSPRPFSSNKSVSSAQISTNVLPSQRTSPDPADSATNTEVDSILAIPKASDGLFHCPATHLGCTRAFARRYNLKTHYATVHAAIKNYACSVCGWKFARRFDMKRHMEKKHNVIDIAPDEQS